MNKIDKFSAAAASQWGAISYERVFHMRSRPKGQPPVFLLPRHLGIPEGIP